ncbi:MAG: hypothetical protein GXO25_06890 [Euryarchaeota archaeon]|nr:hypothetical protein [Euryarchaeota archaeon]
MSIERELKWNGTTLIFFGTVKGLVSEREKLRTVYEQSKPEVMLLGIAPEELEGLKRYLQEPFEIDPADYEVIYAKKLERFGEVGLPVPTYLEAHALSEKYGVEMIPLDMPDEIYSELYSRKLDFMKIMRYDMRKRKIWKMKFDVATPEEFVIEWDREINKIREFMDIEKEREKYMAQRIKEILKDRKFSKALVIIELERMQGVIAHLAGK